jgi:hypothetical protein
MTRTKVVKLAAISAGDSYPVGIAKVFNKLSK